MLRGLALAAVLAAPAVWADSWGTLSPEQREEAEQRITAKRQADHQACRKLQGHARALCVAQVKGDERAALAELEAEHRPSPEATRAAKEARARADYTVAQLRCKAQAKRARERCEFRAEHSLEAAIRQAKVEKVRQVDAQRRAKQAQSRG